MQGGFEHARSLPRPAAPLIVTPAPTPTPTPRPTPTPSPTASPTPRASLTYRSALAGRSLDPTILVGDIAILTLTFRNDGTATWRKGTSSAVYLWTGRDAQFPAAMKEGWAASDVAVYQSEAEVRPEETASFTFRLKGTADGAFTLSLVPTTDAAGGPTALQSSVTITVTVGAIPTPTPTTAGSTPAPATNAPGATVTPSATPTATPTQSAASDGGTIREGETITAECGSGDPGNRVEFVGGLYTGMFGYNIRRTVGADGSVQVVAMVSDPNTGAPRRGPVMWTLSRGLGGVLSVQGCTATFSGATSYGTAMVLIFPAEVASTPVIPSEGGPRNAAGQQAHLVVPNPNAARAPRAACGAEWIQVSITGPYSSSTNWFWIRRLGNVLWWGPFANNGTFNVTPGTYEISIAFAGRPGFTNDSVSVPSCGSQRYIRSNQGWGV